MKPPTRRGKKREPTSSVRSVNLSSLHCGTMRSAAIVTDVCRPSRLIDHLTLVRCHAGVKASEAAERAVGDHHRSAGREEGNGGVAMPPRWAAPLRSGGADSVLRWQFSTDRSGGISVPQLPKRGKTWPPITPFFRRVGPRMAMQLGPIRKTNSDAQHPVRPRKSNTTLAYWILTRPIQERGACLYAVLESPLISTSCLIPS